MHFASSETLGIHPMHACMMPAGAIHRIVEEYGSPAVSLIHKHFMNNATRQKSDGWAMSGYARCNLAWPNHGWDHGTPPRPQNTSRLPAAACCCYHQISPAGAVFLHLCLLSPRAGEGAQDLKSRGIHGDTRISLLHRRYPVRNSG